MNVKVFILSLMTTLLFFPSANAQWRIGATVGVTYNKYSVDSHKNSEVHYSNAWNIPALGVMVQYDVYDWLGIRTELGWISKSHKVFIPKNKTEYTTDNRYLQLPVMASLNIGYKKVHAFLNLGIYGAYWLDSDKSGVEKVGTITIPKPYDNDFNETRDQRFDFGFVGGVGIGWKFKVFERNLVLQVESRIYYSTQSSQKNYMKVNDLRYNTTWALQAGLCYLL